jgi:hypothetical protein
MSNQEEESAQAASMSAGEAVKKKKKQKKREGFVNWRSHNGGRIVKGDLEPGGILNDMDHLPAAFIFEYYKKMPEFEDVCFEQFMDRLKDHRLQASRGLELAKRDADAYRKDQQVHPRQSTDLNGELVFNLHSAKRFLRMDIANNLHKQLSPSELRLTRPAYQEFKLDKFTFRIYQEVRRVKFLNYLESKQQKERPGPSIPHSIVKFHASHLVKQFVAAAPYG